MQLNSYGQDYLMYFDLLVRATSPRNVLRDDDITFTRGAKFHGDDIESSCLCLGFASLTFSLVFGKSASSLIS